MIACTLNFKRLINSGQQISMYYICSFFSFFGGLMPYILFRGFYLTNLQFTPLFSCDIVPYFINYSLSDGLWTMSLTYILISIWKGLKNNSIIAVTSLAPIIGVVLEYLQYFQFINGTFDIIDVFTIIIFYLITINHYYYATKKPI